MTIGWIKLHRLLLEKEIFQDAYVLKTFLYLLLKAAYKEMKFKVGNKNIELVPGQLLYGRKVVSQKLNIGEGKLRGIMEYLVQNGSIEMEAHSKYSIVTIVNWEQYQKGESEPDFPFDVDFLDDEEDEAEPAENQMQMQSETDMRDLDIDFPASSEPQYNKINKYKNNNKIQENKTRENNNKTKEDHKNITDIQNIENIKNIKNMQTISYRQSIDSIDDCGTVERVAGLQSSQEMLLPGGDMFSNGKVGCGDSAEILDVDDSSEALAALSMLDDAALEAYFAGSRPFAHDDTVCHHNGRSIDTASPYEPDFEPDPAEVEYVEAHKLFNELWNQYPVQVGKEKVNDEQILRLYEIGKKKMKHAIINYKGKKHRVPKQYWMNGSTFFNGGYEKYLE